MPGSRVACSASRGDVRLELERIAGTGGSFDAIATHRIASEWGPVRTAGTPVFAPGSYYWPTFLTARNLLNVVNQNADIAIIALGMTLVILTAGIDLSVGSLLALAGVIAAVTAQEWFGGAAASPAGLLAAMLLGVARLPWEVCSAGRWSPRSGCRRSSPRWVLLMVARGLALILAVGHQRRLVGGPARRARRRRCGSTRPSSHGSATAPCSACRIRSCLCSSCSWPLTC